MGFTLYVLFVVRRNVKMFKNLSFCADRLDWIGSGSSKMLRRLSAFSDSFKKSNCVTSNLKCFDLR
jgi:hypothetical protein